MDILTANELLSGAVVYLDGAGRWQPSIDKARLFGANEAEARDREIARGKASGRLIGVETETVAVVLGKVVAARLRERIRAAGTTAPLARERQDLGGSHVSL